MCHPPNPAHSLQLLTLSPLSALPPPPQQTHTPPHQVPPGAAGLHPCGAGGPPCRRPQALRVLRHLVLRHRRDLAPHARPPLQLHHLHPRRQPQPVLQVGVDGWGRGGGVSPAQVPEQLCSWAPPSWAPMVMRSKGRPTLRMHDQHTHWLHRAAVSPPLTDLGTPPLHPHPHPSPSPSPVPTHPLQGCPRAAGPPGDGPPPLHPPRLR
jgi:hypothetical protein